MAKIKINCEKKGPIKKYSIIEAKEILLKITHLPGELKRNLEELGEDILPHYLHGSEVEKIKAVEKLNSKALEILRALEAETRIGLMESVDERYREMVKDFLNQIIKDYECCSVTEKSLASAVALSYVKVLDSSRRLTNELNCQNITPNRNVYIGILSKQADRAQRQFLSALMTLKQLKTPMVEMNIKANTAFVSQNQQINVEKKTNEA